VLCLGSRCGIQNAHAQILGALDAFAVLQRQRDGNGGVFLQRTFRSISMRW
jgi:hypothetical protein